MIKMALDEYDTLEITIGARLPVGLFEVSHREAAGFRHHKPSYRSVTTLGVRRLPKFN
jgi:hypothetical protein